MDELVDDLDPNRYKHLIDGPYEERPSSADICLIIRTETKEVIETYRLDEWELTFSEDYLSWVIRSDFGLGGEFIFERKPNGRRITHTYDFRLFHLVTLDLKKMGVI